MFVLLPLVFALSFSPGSHGVRFWNHAFGNVAVSLTKSVAPPSHSVFADIERSRALARRRGAAGSTAASVNPAAFYVTAVGVGSPPTTYSLLVDIGSSITWVGARAPYKRTATSHDTGATVAVSYGKGNFSGEEYTDRVALGPHLVINNQSIGAASSTHGFNGTNLDGILGLGPVDLTIGVLSTNQSIPTVTDNLFASGVIHENLVSVSFKPITSLNTPIGEVTFGGVDQSKFTGGITYTPVTKTAPANEFWGIDQSVAYGKSMILNLTAGTVDTGASVVLLATDAFQKYQNATGGVIDPSTGLLRITPSQYNKLQNLDFVIGGRTFTLTPNAQIWPRAFNAAIGGSAGNIYLVVADLGSRTGEGLDFINGMPFLERFYSVFDTSGHRIGFAETQSTDAKTN